MELVLQRPQRKESVKKYCILYVDDEPVNLRIFQHAFKRDYVVHTALNGFDALDILNDEKIDLVITDQQMPRMSGVDLLAKIVPKHPDIVRMIMTGFSDIGAIIRAVNEFGLDKYLVKPWDRDQLKVEFDKALEKKSKELATAATSGNAELSNALSEDQLSFFQTKEEINEVFEESILVHDQVNNKNGYWVGELNGDKYAVTFHNKNAHKSSYVMHSFVSMSLTELLYKESVKTLANLLSGLSKKFSQRFGSKNDWSDIDISLFRYNSATNSGSFIGFNSDLLSLTRNGLVNTLKGKDHAFDLTNDFKGQPERVISGKGRVFFGSKNVLDCELPPEIKGANGKGFSEFLKEFSQEENSAIEKSVVENMSDLDKKLLIGFNIQ